MGGHDKLKEEQTTLSLPNPDFEGMVHRWSVESNCIGTS